MGDKSRVEKHGGYMVCKGRRAMFWYHKRFNKSFATHALRDLQMCRGLQQRVAWIEIWEGHSPTFATKYVVIINRYHPILLSHGGPYF